MGEGGFPSKTTGRHMRRKREWHRMGRIWFDHPAKTWEEGLPIGNGRLGAMILGGTGTERIPLNQDSIWYGGPVCRDNPDARGNLEKVRALLLAGSIPEAEELLCLAFSGTPQSQRPYQSLGDLEIVYREPEGGLLGDAGNAGGQPLKEGDGYCRELDLNRGIVTEDFCDQGRKWRKEYLSSYPHGVILIRLQAERGGVCLNARLGRRRFYDHAGKLDESTIFMDGSLGAGGVSWKAALRAWQKGGTCQVIGEHLVIRNADEAVLCLACETSFYEPEYGRALTDRLDRARRDGWQEIKRRHMEDYQALFGNVSLSLGDARGQEPVDKTLARGAAEGFDGSFAETYFQYGRYLLIASSRPGSLPANLQGIWNDSMEPCWDSKYTININTEMNYWPAESCGLSECHLPLFDHLERMWKNGRETARHMYGCRGFVAHHNTDLWGDCAPQDIYVPATYWVMGAAWLCTHIWTHYLYTGDGDFLKKMYPILEDAVLFFHDFLIPVDGKLMTCPSVSPENTYLLPDGVCGCVGVGATADNEILRDLLEDYLKASQVLDKDTETVRETRSILEKIPELQIGRFGQIMEWREDYEEREPGHRHISHLYALYPSGQITTDKTPKLAQAARVTLERRLSHGGGHTGWSCAWIVNFFARLGDGDKALENLEKLWAKSTFPNLMDNHPMGAGYVFQIDGNLGAAAAIAEMLVQSDQDRVKLLPALPGKWSKGKVKGLRVAGGAEIALSWENGKLTECTVVSPRDMDMEFQYGTETTRCALKAGNSYRVFAPEQKA